MGCESSEDCTSVIPLTFSACQYTIKIVHVNDFRVENSEVMASCQL